MDRQDYVIEVSHVSKSFKDNKVLKDVSLLCESGKIYGLVGHNGSGKTVLFKSICGFLSCDEGTITVNGKVMGKDKDMLTDAGIIIEDPGFLRTWSGYHNLEFLYTLRNKKNKDYLCSVLRKVGLDPALKRPVGKYSLGMRQRLALAQAIMEDPGILILDEPMNGLDKNGVREIRELLLKMKEENKLIILASHNREDIEVLRALVFDKRLVQRGIALDDVDEVINDPAFTAHDQVKVTQADVEVDNDRFLSLLGQTCSDGRAGGGLANAPFTRSHNNNACHRNSLLKRD